MMSVGLLMYKYVHCCKIEPVKGNIILFWKTAMLFLNSTCDKPLDHEYCPIQFKYLWSAGAHAVSVASKSIHRKFITQIKLDKFNSMDIIVMHTIHLIQQIWLFLPKHGVPGGKFMCVSPCKYNMLSSDKNINRV